MQVFYFILQPTRWFFYVGAHRSQAVMPENVVVARFIDF